jgi:hypothetical protein
MASPLHPLKSMVIFNPAIRSYELYLYTEERDGSIHAATPAVMERIDEGKEILGPLLRMDPVSAQILIDELWKAGVRPHEIGGAGELAATQRHLDDMRKIAFNFLDMKERS